MQVEKNANLHMRVLSVKVEVMALRPVVTLTTRIPVLVIKNKTADKPKVKTSSFEERYYTPYVDILLEAACVTAYFGFLRCGEFTVLHSFDSECNVSIEDIRFLKDKVTFHLKASKTDPFREGVDIHLFASGASVCPVLSLERYMEFRNRKFKDSKTQDAFFVMENRKALTRNYFISSLKRYLPYLDTIQTYIMVTAFALQQVPQQVQKLKITLFRHSDGGVHSVILDI
ncbi:unnamed protein product [Mytilus coruscus]|uniref:Uncharacterized protein n=1 Tax=Mytilus coruscus TaxID=42192 RepID=A0A6J8DCQ2_MYTCO|nr:unnamed protein product [Mytilus coruscus]